MGEYFKCLCLVLSWVEDGLPVIYYPELHVLQQLFFTRNQIETTCFTLMNKACFLPVSFSDIQIVNYSTSTMTCNHTS
jgi:hypothetical protein